MVDLPGGKSHHVVIITLDTLYKQRSAPLNTVCARFVHRFPGGGVIRYFLSRQRVELHKSFLGKGDGGFRCYQGHAGENAVYSA